MKTNNILCRIGVFYDGSYFAYAQRHFYHEAKLGWLTFTGFHNLIERYVWEMERVYSQSKVVYSAWFQGLDRPNESNEKQLRSTRHQDFDLMYSGTIPKYLPKSFGGKEKGVDVELAIDALQTGLDGKIDVAVLVTGDSDLVPLARALMRNGIRVMVAYFEYGQDESASRISEHLLAACNYGLDFNQLEANREYQSDFEQAFYKRPSAN
jgi:uncharacterized LabA/DUF88 family protein